MSTPLAPLSAEERAEVRRQLDELRVYTSAIPATGLLSQTIRDMGEAMSRLLAERDSLERERDEARAQIFAAHAERNEADRDLAVAQEQVRSLTVERDALVVSRDECFDRATREAKAADEARARFSRAREALVDYSAKWAALRAALAEPPANG